jgi:hypothetical protein
MWRRLPGKLGEPHWSIELCFLIARRRPKQWIYRDGAWWETPEKGSQLRESPVGIRPAGCYYCESPVGLPANEQVNFTDSICDRCLTRYHVRGCDLSPSADRGLMKSDRLIHEFKVVGAAMSSRWYYQLMIEEFGPVNAEQLLELLEIGTLSDGDLVRQESSETWIPISDVRQTLLADSGNDSSSLSEEIGDLSELAFEFEDSGPTTRRSAYAEDVIAEVSTTSDPPVRTPAAAAAIASASIPSPPAIVPPEKSQQAREELTEQWFCESFGQVMGPMSFEELLELGKSGALDANDRVKCGERGAWKIVEHLPSVMRAVALSRTIEVDPQVVSAATQKRLGDTALAAMVNGPEESAPTAAPSKPATQKTTSPTSAPAAAATASVTASPAESPKSDEAATATGSTKPASGKAKTTKPRPKRSKNSKGEDKLLDEIFDDVFNDDNAPTLPKAHMHPVGASSMAPVTASPGNLQSPNSGVQNPAAAPSFAASPSPSMMSSTSNAAGLAAAAMAARPIPVSKSSGRSFDFDPKVIGMFVAVLLVGAGGYYVWQSGMLTGALNGSGSFDRAGAVKTLEAGMARYKAIGTSPSEAEWKEFSVKTKLEMSALFKSVYDRAGATPQGAACLASITALMKIAGTTPDNTEAIEKHIADFEKQIPLVTKD